MSTTTHAVPACQTLNSNVEYTSVIITIGPYLLATKCRTTEQNIKRKITNVKNKLHKVNQINKLLKMA